jgi:GT2 family glycosyltransferase
MIRAGVVVIGRNEGEGLRRCLESSALSSVPRLYVDSASSDGSPALARSLGWDVLELEASRPMSAARARNEGFERLLSLHPELEAVQFVDGDCVVAEGWIERACRELEARSELAIVAGRLRERNPEASVYNRLCAIEWDVPPGDAKECGGLALMRSAAFRQAEGFRAGLVAGEEPELCLRLRRAGWKIARIDAEMASHDAAMTRFSQWWTRTVRSGRGYAQATAVHGLGFCGRMNFSILFWALALPLAAAGAAWPTRGWSLLLFAAYPLLVLRIALGRWRRGSRAGDSWLYAFFCVLAKLPQLVGQGTFLARRKRPLDPVDGRNPDAAPTVDSAAGKR